METKDDYAVPARGCALSPDGRLAIGEYTICVCVSLCVSLCCDCRRRLLFQTPLLSCVFTDLLENANVL